MSRLLNVSAQSARITNSQRRKNGEKKYTCMWLACLMNNGNHRLIFSILKNGTTNMMHNKIKICHYTKKISKLQPKYSLFCKTKI